MKTYTALMDDGKRLTKPCASAVEMIGWALEQHLGHRVSKCWVGMEAAPAWKHQEAIMYFDVPAHEPLATRQGRNASKRVRGEATLFDDGQILSESAQARTKAAQGSVAMSPPIFDGTKS